MPYLVKFASNELLQAVPGVDSERQRTLTTAAVPVSRGQTHPVVFHLTSAPTQHRVVGQALSHPRAQYHREHSPHEIDLAVRMPRPGGANPCLPLFLTTSSPCV